MRHALATLLGTVQRTIRAHAMLAPGDRVLVAVSGGPDSTGLLLCLAVLRRKLGVELIAAHVNHRLRGADADRDESCAAAAAARLAVPFVRAELPASLRRGGNLEARARRLRYAALRELATREGCALIATGHTLDDQAETVLMRLIRGSGGRGLGAVQPRRADGVVRPLLDCRRSDVEAVVRQADLEVCRDASNGDARFLRTHVRERVLPLLAELNPAISRACANLAAAARAERAIVAHWADEQLGSGAAAGTLEVARLRAVAPALRALLVRRWLILAGVSRRGLGAAHVEAVGRLAAAANGRALVQLPGGWAARRDGGWLRIEPRPAAGTARRPEQCEKPF